MDAAVVSMLARWWGIEGVTAIARARGGYTNTTWLVDAPAGRFALRRSWSGKPDERAEAEERILAAILDPPVGPRLAVPRVIATVDGSPHVRDGDATLHLFARVDGDPGPRWLDGATGAARATAAMTALAHLHHMLARLAVADDGDACGASASPRSGGDQEWAHLHARLARIRAGRLDGLPAGAAGVLDTAERALEIPAPGPIQWLQGDFHLGNLLWRGDDVTGIVDFDDVGIGAIGGEVALAAFALARRQSERFTYDSTLWRVGLAAYDAVSGSMAPLDARAGSPPAAVGMLDEPSLARVFCVSQLLVHLEAAQRGLWTLEDPGLELAFWPYWHALSE